MDYLRPIWKKSQPAKLPITKQEQKDHVRAPNIQQPSVDRTFLYCGVFYVWLCLVWFAAGGLNPHLKLCFDHQTTAFPIPISRNTFYYSIPILSMSILERHLPQRHLEGHGQNLVVHTKPNLMFFLLAAQTLQCYTCHEPTAVDKCLMIQNCTKNETMCKTTMYSLEDGKGNYFFIHFL